MRIVDKWFFQRSIIACLVSITGVVSLVLTVTGALSEVNMFLSCVAVLIRSSWSFSLQQLHSVLSELVVLVLQSI